MLFTFPSRYWFTIGRQEYLALDGGPPGFPHEETFHVVLRDTSGSRIAFAYGAVTLCGGPFQATSTNEPICNSLPDSQTQLVGPTTPRLQRLRPITQPRFGLLRFRSPLLTECSLLLEVLRCFSSLGVLVTVYVFNRASRDITPGGFPHSDISGSTLARNSPKHFAACHVLRRLLAPRHPPHALSSLTYSVHAASTVLACAVQLRSRRNLLDEIDASTLRLLRSCARSRERSPLGSLPGPTDQLEADPVDAS